MTGTNTFRSKNIQNNSGNYINNKRQKTTYREIINNNFRNVENTHFTNGGSNSNNLRISGGNNIIALRSVGGPGIYSQSRRLDIARGRAFSESLFINNENASRIIEQPDPTCQKNGNIVTTRPRRLINLSLDMNNANFLTNKQRISCQEKIKDKLKFNNRFILEPNLNLSTRILLNNDPLSNLNLNTQLEVGEENCIKTIIRLPQKWFPIRKSPTLPIQEFPIRSKRKLPESHYPQRDIKEIPTQNYPQRDIKNVPTINFPRIEAREIPTENYPQKLFNVPIEHYPERIPVQLPLNEYPRFVFNPPSTEYPRKILAQIPSTEFPRKIPAQIPSSVYPERTHHLIPTQVQGNFAHDPERLLSLAMVLDPSTVVYNYVNRIEFNRHYTDIYTFPPNPLDLSLNSNYSYIAPKWLLPKRVDISSSDISSSYVIFNDPYEISYNLTSTGFEVTINTNPESILYGQNGSLITYQPDMCNNWFFRINRSLNSDPYWLDNTIIQNNTMNHYNPVSYLESNHILHINVSIESQTVPIRRDTGFMLHNNFTSDSSFINTFRETLIGLNYLFFIQHDNQVFFGWDSSNNSRIVADLSLSTINDLINYGIVYDNNIFDLSENHTISNNILVIKDVSENGYSDSNGRNYTTVEFSPELYNILTPRQSNYDSQLPFPLRFRFLTTLSGPQYYFSVIATTNMNINNWLQNLQQFNRFSVTNFGDTSPTQAGSAISHDNGWYYDGLFNSKKSYSYNVPQSQVNMLSGNYYLLWTYFMPLNDHDFLNGGRRGGGYWILTRNKNKWNNLHTFTFDSEGKLYLTDIPTNNITDPISHDDLLYVQLENDQLSQRINLAHIYNVENPAGHNNVLTKWNYFWSISEFTGPSGELLYQDDGNNNLALARFNIF